MLIDNKIELISSQKLFEGYHKRYKHFSQSTQSEMTFAVYLPPKVLENKKAPTLYWLSGLTCDDTNFSTKSGAQKYASQYGIILIIPDTSPRGESIPNDIHYDLGQGAGFYVNATQDPWKKNYQMYDYITKELPELIEYHFPINSKKSISGHSMGGHGALMIALKNTNQYESVSAFSPIVNPSYVPWGKKALSTYLGNNIKAWEEYDSIHCLENAKGKIPILIEQGENDEFLHTQLQPDLFVKKALKLGFSVTLNLRPGYDHSYFFISSFIKQHIKFHASFLQ